MSRVVYVQDPIWGLIEIPDLCLKFVNTPEFQRLKRIRQLGMTPEVFPSGIHTRAEHCLGTMYISGLAFESLLKNSDRIWGQYIQYKPLIQIAALLHDLGHGAFSHIFEEAMKIRNIMFCHEQHSSYLINRANKRIGVLNEEELQIVKNMILGKCMDDLPPFLFQIVANKESGLDTDKMDYLLRDSYHIGKKSISVDYIIKHARVDEYGNISYSAKSISEIRTLFAFRKQMYETVYYHPTVKKLDKIMICALLQIPIDTSDPDCFFKLDDYSVMYKIRYELKHELIDCLDNRKIMHQCEKCPKVKLIRTAKLSGDVDDDPLNHIRFYES